LAALGKLLTLTVSSAAAIPVSATDNASAAITTSHRISLSSRLAA
jgi:hypothetical protein